MPLKVVISFYLAIVMSACSSVGSNVGSSSGGEDLFRTSLSQQLPHLDPDYHIHDGHDISHAVPEGLLTPEAAQQLALLGSPSVREALAGVGVVEAERMQSSLLSNPGFSVKALRPDSGGPWKTEFALTLGIIDWFTRPLRLQIADQALTEAQLQAWDQVSAALNETQAAWYQAVAAHHKAAVHASIAEASAVNADFARSLYEAGNLSELAMLRYEAAAATQRNAARLATSQAENARHQLNRAIGLPIHTALELPESLPGTLDETLEFDALHATAMERRPDLALIRQSDAALQRSRELERRQRGVTQGDIGLVAEREFNGDWHPGVRAGLSLPVFDRGQARMASLDSRSEALAARQRVVELQLQQEIADALSVLDALQQQWHQLSHEDLPRFETMLDLALREYNFMLTGTFDLVDIKQQALDVQLKAVETLQQYWLTRSRLDQATGNALAPVSENHLFIPALELTPASVPDDHDHDHDHNHNHDHDHDVQQQQHQHHEHEHEEHHHD